MRASIGLAAVLNLLSVTACAHDDGVEPIERAFAPDPADPIAHRPATLGRIDAAPQREAFGPWSSSGTHEALMAGVDRCIPTEDGANPYGGEYEKRDVLVDDRMRDLAIEDAVASLSPGRRDPMRDVLEQRAWNGSSVVIEGGGEDVSIERDADDAVGATHAAVWEPNALTQTTTWPDGRREIRMRLVDETMHAFVIVWHDEIDRPLRYALTFDRIAPYRLTRAPSTFGR